MPIQPTTCKLTNGCQQQFTLAGAAGAITWAIAPAGVGQFLSPGLYQAPDPITAPAQVTISTTMGGVTESATVKLVPPEVILAPAGKVTLTTGQTQQFIATVPGDPANQVQWTLAPTVGAIAGGVYTPPHPIPGDCEVIVTAMCAIDQHKTATATLALITDPPWIVWIAGLFLYLVAIFGLVVFMVVLWPPEQHSKVDNLHAARIAADNKLQTARQEEQKWKAAKEAAEDELAKNTSNTNLQKKSAAATAAFTKAATATQEAETGLKTSQDAERQETDRVQAGEVAPVMTRFGDISREADLIWLVLLAGALGSFIYGAKSFVAFVGNRTLRLSWSAWYFMYPLIGAALALVFYLVVRGGLLTPANKTNELNLYGLLAIAGMVGMFSKQATNKLDEVFSTMFTTSKDNALQNKLK